MTVSIFLRSNACTFLLAVLLELCRHEVGKMSVWLFVLAGYLLAMLWWLIQLDHADHRMLPRDDDPTEFPPMPEEQRPFHLVGVSDKGRVINRHRGWRANLGANVNPPAPLGPRPEAPPPPPMGRK